MTLSKVNKDHNLPPCAQWASCSGKLILKIAQTYTEERNLLDASQFGFCTSYSMTVSARLCG